MPDEKRKAYLEGKVRDFCLEYGIFSWPVDCVALAKRLALSHRLPLQLQTVTAAARMDASTLKNAAGQYLILLNDKRGGYPFLSSQDCRRNFTVAHELGHIFLGHCEIPEDCKTPQSKCRDEEDANYFAACLLLPEALLRICNFVSSAQVARAFLVSGSALSRRLQELDLTELGGKRMLRRCPLCGCFAGPEDLLCARCGGKLSGEVPPVLPQPVLFYPLGYQGLPHLVFDPDISHMAAQFETERLLRQRYGTLQPVPIWGEILKRLETSLQAKLRCCCMLRSGKTLLFCLHRFDLIGWPGHSIKKLTGALHQAAARTGAREILAVPYYALQKDEPLPAFAQWAESAEIAPSKLPDLLRDILPS